MINQNEKKNTLSVLSIVTTLGHWAFTNLTVVTFGGLLIVAILTPFLKQNGGPIGFAIAGCISGLLVGFLPFFEEMIENQEIKRLLPWIKAFSSILTLILLAFTFLNALITRSFILVFLWFLPGIAISLLVTWITRPVCDRMLTYNVKWWMWILTAIGVIGVMAIIGLFVVYMASR